MGQNLLNLERMPNMGILWCLAYNSAIFCPIYLESATFYIKFLLFFGLSYFFWAVLLSYFFPEKVLDTLDIPDITP